jgi:hypothetical protein
MLGPVCYAVELAGPVVESAEEAQLGYSLASYLKVWAFP